MNIDWILKQVGTYFALFVLVGICFTLGYWIGATETADNLNNMWLEYLNSTRHLRGGAA